MELSSATQGMSKARMNYQKNKKFDNSQRGGAFRGNYRGNNRRGRYNNYNHYPRYDNNNHDFNSYNNVVTGIMVLHKVDRIAIIRTIMRMQQMHKIVAKLTLCFRYILCLWFDRVCRRM
eukprot:696700_1